MIDEIFNTQLIAEVNVVCELANYYYKESVMMENSEIIQEGFIRENLKKIWALFINALKSLSRWFHKKTKYAFMKKRMEKATPKEIKKFESALRNIDEFLDSVSEILAETDKYDGHWHHLGLAINGYGDRLNSICPMYYEIFGGEGEL